MGIVAMNHDEHTTDTLLLYVTGKLDRDGSSTIEAHLRDCAKCSASVERASVIADVLREQRAVIQEPPARVGRMAADLFGRVRPDLVRSTVSGGEVIAQIAPGSGSLPSRFRRIVADLTFDSLGSSAFAGLRAASRTSRYLAYQSELGNLDLQFTSPLRSPAADGRWRVMGQLELVDPLPADTAIRFLRDDVAGDDVREPPKDESTSAAVDARGYFTVDLPPGAWSAHLVVGETVVVFHGISL